MNKLTSGITILAVTLILIVMLIIIAISANWHYQNDYLAYWNLAEKASTISQKSDYIDKFVSVLEKSGLQGTNANLIWSTRDSSFDENFKALKSLQSRLDDIKTMDINSFAYQTAIQQITAQEQGEAQNMLNVIEACWFRINYYYLWNPLIAYGMILILIISIFLGIFLLNSYDSYEGL